MYLVIVSFVGFVAADIRGDYFEEDGLLLAGEWVDFGEEMDGGVEGFGHLV